MRVATRAFFIVMGMALATLPAASVSAAQATTNRSSGRSPSASGTAACYKDATVAAPSRVMPKPTRLVRPISLTWNGTITLAPPPASLPTVENPSTIWKTFPGTVAGSQSRLFLAYFTASVPASLEPDGSLQPFSNHVLSWVLLSQHVPFDTAGISIPAGTKPPPVTCRFVGQDITAWNALTGAALQGGGFHVPSHPLAIRPSVLPWHR